MSTEKIRALDHYETSPLYSEKERLALCYADRMTHTDKDVDDTFFEALRAVFDEDALIELTAVIAWENASSKFNRAMRVPSQELWQPDTD